MSTSLLSHFSHLGFDLDNSVQNHNMNDHLAVGAPTRNRNYQIGTFNSGSSAFIPVNANSNYSSTIMPPSTMNMLSTDNHRKLDRSWSEPCEKNIRNVTPTTVNTTGTTSPNVNSSRYKTELCRPFEENGHCKYGDKCQFAHGKQELQNLARHPKYKTDLCRTFHTIGFCPYGPRCHFIHSEEERKLVLKQQAAAAMVQHPGVIQRPNSIKFTSLSSLGSSLDSPSSSVNVSPTTLSPSFFGSGDDIFSSASHTSFSPNTQQSVSSGSSRSSPVFNSPELDWMTPLNVQTSTNNDISALHHQFTGLNLNQQQKYDANQNVFEPEETFLSQVFRESQTYNDAVPSTSPVDSLSGLSVGSTSSVGSGSSNGFGTCNSPMEVSRGMRLPIFNRLSQEL